MSVITIFCLFYLQQYIPWRCSSVKVRVTQRVDCVQFTTYSSDLSKAEQSLSKSGIGDPGALGGGFT